MKVAAYCAVAGIDIAWSVFFAAEVFRSETIPLDRLALFAVFLAGALYFILAAIMEAAE